MPGCPTATSSCTPCPMFHANGWGMPYAVTAIGGRHVVQRKIDGEVILARIETEGVTLLCAAPAVVASILAASEERLAAGRPLPSGPVRIIVAGAPPPSKTIERVESELGWEFIQIYGLTETSPLLTINRAPEEWEGLEPAERARRLSRAGVPAVGVRMALSEDGEVLAAFQPRVRGLLAPARGVRQGAGRRVVPHRRRRLPGGPLHGHQRSQEGRDHHRGRERLVDRGRGRPLPARGGGRGRGDRRPRREVGREGARAGRPQAGRDGERAGPHRALPGPHGPLQGAPRASRSARSWRARRPGSSRSTSSASPTGRAGSDRSTEACGCAQPARP